MTPGNTVYLDLPRGQKKVVKTCRAVIQEINGGVARLQVWDGRKIFQHNAMLRDLRINQQPNTSDAKSTN